MQEVGPLLTLASLLITCSLYAQQPHATDSAVADAQVAARS